ncbi:uncharacterized protein Z520_02726 [Fonsecaea multimorphosa CBS 102226]|uniref:Uncharacterized protein n=1 Tax=Fonsecaea multimorphosa CBS 102226 TaxID=1442371 RepID=A0A0D2KWI8_9EURO|nr:uncharacterized protein Z520_02726 [Fonsecaea multimorphosa CBS 102226]KIY01174.1 hypothetical protein Z520_02726 [Fonsecaea multimorphosa CBS 102226]OAL28787.1 hypothetical protein AYO22_02652 [Fonsecaea multimorphosa]
MAYSRRSSGSDREYVLMPVHSVAGSEYGGRGRRVYDPPIEVNNFLEVPQTRPRASSQGGGVAPTIVNIGAGALSERGDRDRDHSRSRSRHRDYRHHRYRDGSSSSSYSSDRSRSRHRRHSSHKPPKKQTIEEDDLPYKLRKELDFARMSHRDEEEKRILDRIKKDREEERRRWKLEEEEDAQRKKKEREAILYEAKLEEERKQKEREELRKKILRDEEERQQKEKEKKKAEEDEFERKVKEKFMNAGYSPEYIDEVLHKKKAERATLAIDLHRPTYIKVNRKYLLPDTLDHYGLPWEWDPRDEEFIIIKKYIDHSLQDELFEHTRKIKERKLITGPFIKETKTITTLTPNDHGYVKKGDRMYVVREKSKSRSPAGKRTSWMFT